MKMSRRQSSIFSIGSLVLTSKQDISSCDDMTDTELQEALKNISHSNLLLKLENDVFERYLSRRDPESLQSITQLLETARRVSRIASQSQQISVSPIMSRAESIANMRDAASVISIQTGSRRFTSSVLTARTTKGGMKIGYAQRIEIVNAEIRDMLREFDKLERTTVKRRMLLRMEMEETEIRIRETRETKEEFEENVVRKGVDSITGKIPAEKFIRFIEEWLRKADSTMERIRLKIIGIKSEIGKAKLQLKQRKEIGEALRAVDFEQLSIKNQDCIRKIDEKNQYLLEMKRIAGRYSIALTKHKGKANDLVSDMNETKSKIITKKQEITKLQSEQTAMKIEIKKMQEQVTSLITLMDDFKVPDVMEFVKMREELEKLRRIHKQINRQRQIQQLTFKTDK